MNVNKKFAGLFALIPLILASCGNANEGNIKYHENGQNTRLSLNFDSINLDPNIKIAVDSFVKYVNCPKCIFEMHINKILPDSFLISLIAGL